MIKILHIDSSPNLTKSFSRTYSRKVVDKIIGVRGKCEIIRRDLVRNQVPAVTENWYSGAYKPNIEERTVEEIEALKFSDILVDELLASDYIVIGSPMHNFCVPAVLKLYIDQISRRGRTWGKGYVGLVTGKKVIAVLTRGSWKYDVGEDWHHMNHDETYLTGVLGFLGIKDVQFIKLNNLAETKLGNLKLGDKADLSYKGADEEIESLEI